MSIRKKRNFRDLQLPSTSLGPRTADSDSAEPIPTRHAPLGPRKRAPQLHENGITADPFSPDAASIQASLSNTIASLDRKPKYKEFDLKNDTDFTILQELGQGNGGSVMKVQHVPTGTVMAKKIVLIDAKPAERKKIVLELQIMHDCDSQYIVSSYGAYLAEPNICICMEFMDKGSFDGIYKRIGAIDIRVVGKVAVAVLEGLRYLYDVHRIIHRDIKPSNILCNSSGDIKLCDFGVSGELVNSIANTFVGTSIYMSVRLSSPSPSPSYLSFPYSLASLILVCYSTLTRSLCSLPQPERIQGATYSVKSDIWSLGITLIELSVGQFPFSGSFSDSEDNDNDSDLEHDRDSDMPPPPPPKDSSPFTPSSPHSSGNGGDATPNPRDSLQIPSSAARRRRRSKGVSLHGGGMMMSIIELMHQIVNEPSPRLPQGKFGREADEFVNACLEKEVERRGTPRELFDYAWISNSRENGMDMKAWAATF
ncbi:STE/STE7/MEK1 protein kinase [Favolaschia claudopus]|uniref:STE/STE7/MEK1 protein kinase n=1 Tax=Favolaschia claudopus TaxID=2862362 RepID=A0AAW0CT16_9AGAR